MSPWIAAPAAFFGMFALDVCWALYTVETATKQAGRASAWAVLLHLLGALVTLTYVEDKRYLVLTCVGAYIGTYVGIRYSSRREK